mgnify:CR=1 FL=1
MEVCRQKVNSGRIIILVVIKISTTLLVGRFVTDQNKISIMGSAIESSGARGGVTIVLLVDDGMDCLNEQQNPKSTFGSSMLFNANAMDLRAKIEGSSCVIFLLLAVTTCVRPMTQKLQTLQLQFWQCTYAMSSVLEGVPASTVRADDC